MKKLFLSLTVFALSTSLFAQKKLDEVVEFKSEIIDLGKVKVGNPPTATFIVINKGTEPLIIEQANPTCGCTIGDYTKSPIAPGKEGWIKATYNAANVGSFDKHMTVKFAGFDETKSIGIKGEVLSAEDYAKLKGTAAAETNTATEAKTTASTDTEVKTKTVTKTATTKQKTKTTAPAKKAVVKQ